MNIEMPVGLLIMMTLLNIIMVLVIAAEFPNLKRVFNELISWILNTRRVE